MNNVADWLQAASERLIDSVSCNQPFADPADCVIAAEEALVEATGYNLNDLISE